MTTMSTGFGFEIKRDGTLNALTEPAHRGRNVGRRIWIGGVTRHGSGWAGFSTTDVERFSFTGFKRQMDAASAVYNAWLAGAEVL